MSDLSRVEQLLRNALGEDIYEVTPQSRVEALLVELNELIEGIRASVSPEELTPIVTAWLAENIHDGAVVDASLSVAGAAAESQKTGEEISQLKEDLMYESGAVSNFAVDGYAHLNPSEFIVGGIDTDTGAVDTSQNKRIVTSNILTAPYDMTFRSASGYKHRVIKYTDGVMTDRGSWTSDYASTAISKGQDYRVLIANYPTEVIVTDVFALTFGVIVNTLFVDLLGCIGVDGEVWG